MQKKDILELKRRLKKDGCTFTKMRGCYVDSQKNIVLHINETFLNLDEARLRAFLPEAVRCGLDGMEVLYPKFSREETELAGRIAEEYSLLPSGGSDFHGENKPDIALGTGKAELRVPKTFFEALRARKE